MSENLRMALPGHDELARLARDDPEALETLRRELIESHIASAPEKLQLKLRRLQFRIDGIRFRSATPYSASRKIYALMWESLLELNQELQLFRDHARGRVSSPALAQASRPSPKRDASVIQFEPRRAN